MCNLTWSAQYSVSYRTFAHHLLDSIALLTPHSSHAYTLLSTFLAAHTRCKLLQLVLVPHTRGILLQLVPAAHVRRNSSLPQSCQQANPKTCCKLPSHNFISLLICSRMLGTFWPKNTWCALSDKLSEAFHHKIQFQIV